MPSSSEMLILGTLKKRCTEAVDILKCAGCGDTSNGTTEWKMNGGRCPICATANATNICRRCGGGFADPVSGAEHPCRSVDEFKKSGHVAFPEAAPASVAKPAAIGAHAPKATHRPHSPPPKSSHPIRSPHPPHGPAAPASPTGESTLSSMLNSEQCKLFMIAATYALIAAAVFFIERALLGAWFASDGGLISTQSPRYGAGLSLVASSVFLVSIWFFLPFKPATLVAVLVALLIEGVFDIAGQCIVNVDWLLAGQDSADGLYKRGMVWGISGGILSFGMRYASKALDEGGTFIFLVWIVSSIWLIRWLIY